MILNGLPVSTVAPKFTRSVSQAAWAQYSEKWSFATSPLARADPLRDAFDEQVGDVVAVNVATGKRPAASEAGPQGCVTRRSPDQKAHRKYDAGSSKPIAADARGLP